MKVIQYGSVVLTPGPVKVEDWVVEREDSDPAEATNEQLLLEVAIPWAQKKMNAAILENLQRISKEKKAAQAMQKQKEVL